MRGHRAQRLTVLAAALPSCGAQAFETGSGNALAERNVVALSWRRSFQSKRSPR